MWKTASSILKTKRHEKIFKKAKRVIIAVLEISPGFIGTWWYPDFRPTGEKIEQIAGLDIGQVWLLNSNGSKRHRGANLHLSDRMQWRGPKRMGA